MNKPRLTSRIHNPEIRRDDPRVKAVTQAMQGLKLFKDWEEDTDEPLWRSAALLVEIVLNVDKKMKTRRKKAHEQLRSTLSDVEN